jgi:hypothetical protein
MLSWLLVAQIVASDTATYSSAGLQTFVAMASERNRNVPAALRSYRATVEAEIAIVARRAEGMEGTVSLEQIQNEVRWRYPGEYEQRVVGYRTQSLGLSFSSLGFIRQPWTVPILYGNRLSILFGRDTTSAARRRATRQRMTAVHPLAEDRDRFYRFSGGDTVITMRVGERDLPIVRVGVTPRDDAPPRTLAFRGELDLDATRHHLVRLRGYFVQIAPPRPSLVARAFLLTGFQAIAFVELENGEFDGQYWLPTRQRIDAQAAWTAASDARSVYRMISRFRHHVPNDTSVAAATDSLIATHYRLERAPGDSLSAFRAWRLEMGDMTGDVHSSDFDDIAPDVWRPTGAPRTEFRVQRVMDAVRVNRVEGVFTGWGVQRRFRDQVPGLTLRANGGWAWQEETVRGRASAELHRGRWTLLARGGRSLDITNDFRSAFDSGSTLGALFGVDDYDYVDRRLAAVGVHRRIGREIGIWRLETGPASDRQVVPQLSRGLFRGDSGFRENRGVDEGSYWRTWTALEWHPDVNAEFMRTGMGGLVSVEHVQGDLRYTRVDARLVLRRNRGPLSFAARGDVGVLGGDNAPPQQLFEVGRNQNLQGYGYKEFVGDRAVVGRALAMWRLPALEAPIPVGRWLLPGLTPALSFGVQAARTSLRDQNRGSNLRLDSRLYAPEPDLPNPPPLPIVIEATGPTEGWRTSVTLGLRFFGGAIGLGLSRPTDRAGAWKLRADFGQIL